MQLVEPFQVYLFALIMYFEWSMTLHDFSLQ